ncbi:MAG: NlpC/P60 family protein [Desulfobacterales bacterium]|jgi:cell wall-associated NlpC family hydrolase
MEQIQMRLAIQASPRCKWLFYVNLFALAVCLITISCTTTPVQPEATILKIEPSQTAEPHYNDREIEKRLRQEYRRWKGIRHRLGGSGTRGIDCSGFVKTIYKDVFNIDLPRTSKAQLKHGRPVSFQELQAGDLVFFKPPTYPRHVGIFLSDSEFVHASKNKGVTLSKIDKTYWRKYYWTARRILSPSKHP